MNEFQVLLDAPGKPTSRVQIARVGPVSDSRYGDFAITAENAENWARNLAALPGGRALVDFEHRSERKPRDSQAAGWITGISRDGERILADVEWTKQGAKAIKSKRYLFLSPAFGTHTTEDGVEHDDTLMSVALTNKPALTSLPAVTLAAPERLELAEGAVRMLDVSQAVRDRAKAAGHSLPDGSYPIETVEQLHSAAVLAASHHGDYKAARKLIRRRAADLGVALSHLPGFASDGKGRKAKQMDAAPLSVRTLEQQAADEGKIVLDQAELRELQQARVDRDRDRFAVAFDAAVRARKVTPGERGGLQRLYTLDAVTTLESIALRQPIMLDRPTDEPSIEFDRFDVDNFDFDGQAATRAGMAPGSVLLDQKIRSRLRETGRPITEYQAAAVEILGAS